jgi:hypothetical protein
MARGSRELPKVSLGLTIPYPSPPSGLATPETALQPFQGWPARRAVALSHLLPTWTRSPRRAPMILADCAFCLATSTTSRPPDGSSTASTTWITPLVAITSARVTSGQFRSGGKCGKSENTKFALRVANPRAADRPPGGWQRAGRIVMTP